MGVHSPRHMALGSQDLNPAGLMPRLLKHRNCDDFRGVWGLHGSTDGAGGQEGVSGGGRIR